MNYVGNCAIPFCKLNFQADGVSESGQAGYKQTRQVRINRPFPLSRRAGSLHHGKRLSFHPQRFTVSIGKNFDNTCAGARYRAGALSRLAFSSNKVETHDHAEAKEVPPGAVSFRKKNREIRGSFTAELLTRASFLAGWK